MANLEISYKGTTSDIIAELAIIMLEHEQTRKIVFGAAACVVAIEIESDRRKAEELLSQMKEIIKGGSDEQEPKNN